MYLATIRRLHIPELCRYEGHCKELKDDIVIHKFNTLETLTQTIALWSSDCWVYALTKVERTYELD